MPFKLTVSCIGIHGCPKVPWDNVEGKNLKVDRDDWWGYCAHSVETFPTWHRPYIAMMEVGLYVHSQIMAF